jgi:DNA-binding HxlR family transcriptional regulator
VGAAVGPHALLVLESFGERFSARRRANAASVIQAASLEMGGSLDDFVAATEDPRRESVAATAVLAGGSTAFQDKLVVLGRLLGRALSDPDDARLDEHAQLILAVADLEAPHMALLGKLSETRMITPDPRRPNNKRSSQAYSRAELARAFPAYGASLDALLATLERHGLVSRVPIDIDRAIAEQARRLEDRAARRVTRPTSQPPTQWSRTAFGRAACEAFHEAAERADRET